jgi:hypothetical protein
VKNLGAIPTQPRTPQQHPDDAEDKRAQAGPAVGGLGDVAYRAHDVQAAGAEGGEDDGDEGDDDPQAVGDDQAAGGDLGLNRDPERLEDGAHDLDHGQRHQHSQRRADEGRAQIVGHSFRQEGLDQLAALGAQRAGHAHLRLSLGSQHHEDHEDEENAGGDGEEAHHQEHGAHDVAEDLSIVDELLFHLHHFHVGDVLGLECGLDRGGHCVRKADAIPHAAAVGDGDDVEFPFAAK